MRTPTHPRDMLQKEYLEPMGVSLEDIWKPLIEFYDNGRPVDSYIARVLAAFTGTTSSYWLNLQGNWDRRGDV